MVTRGTSIILNVIKIKRVPVTKFMQAENLDLYDSFQKYYKLESHNTREMYTII